MSAGRARRFIPPLVYDLTLASELVMKVRNSGSLLGHLATPSRRPRRSSPHFETVSCAGFHVFLMAPQALLGTIPYRIVDTFSTSKDTAVQQSPTPHAGVFSRQVYDHLFPHLLD